MHFQRSGVRRIVAFLLLQGDTDVCFRVVWPSQDLFLASVPPNHPVPSYLQAKLPHEAIHLSFSTVPTVFQVTIAKTDQTADNQTENKKRSQSELNESMLHTAVTARAEGKPVEPIRIPPSRPKTITSGLLLLAPAWSLRCTTATTCSLGTILGRPSNSLIVARQPATEIPSIHQQTSAE